jgi:hypothetical protein
MPPNGNTRSHASPPLIVFHNSWGMLWSNNASAQADVFTKKLNWIDITSKILEEVDGIKFKWSESTTNIKPSEQHLASYHMHS